MRRSSIVLTGGVGCALAIASLFLWRIEETTETGVTSVAAETPLKDALPSPSTDGGFITSQSCRECHADQYASWHKSFHRTMTQLATPQSIPAELDDAHLGLRGEEFHVTRQGDEYWVEIERPSPAGGKSSEPATEAVSTSKHRLVMTTGSHHFQLFWRSTGAGNLMKSLPFVYLQADHRIVSIEDAVLAPTGPNGDSVWNETCIQCHSVGPAPNLTPKVDHAASQVAELGISCERCHGPGEAHARHYKNNPTASRGRQLDSDIVLPTRLDHRASTQVCGQCHSLADWMDDWDQYRRIGYRYRPGDELANDRHIVRPTERATDDTTRAINKVFFEGQLGGERAEFWDDCTPRVSGREYNSLLESACYLRGEMSCVSCHSLHQGDPNQQITVEMRGNEACLQCHEQYRERLTEHTHHPAGSSGSQCYNCHMPHTSYGLLTFTRSHRIDSPSVAAHPNSDRPNACVLCHLDQSNAWAANHLTDWYGQPRVEPKEDDKIAVAPQLALRGDCCQRALVAWHARWEPAREVSGSTWLTPFMVQLLDDDYAAVRYQAAKTLKTLPDFKQFTYDYVSPENVRAERRQQADKLWQEHAIGADRRGPSVLLDSQGHVMADQWQRLLKSRDRRPLRCVN